MIIGASTYDLHIQQAHSLKDKRSVLKSLMKRTKGRFNVSIAELDYHDTHQRALIGVAVISNSKKHAAEMLDNVGRFIESGFEVEISLISTEIY